MISLRRSTAAWLCIGAGVAPFLLFFYVLIRENTIRHRMMEELEEKHLTEIVIANETIQWVRPGKEIRVDGRMFDIHSYATGKAKTVFRGLFDEEETGLKKMLAMTMEKNTTGRIHWLALLFQKLQNQYPTHLIGQTTLPGSPAKPLAPPGAATQKGYRLIFSPPPQA